MLTNVIGTKLFVAFPETLPKGFFGVALVLTTGIITYPITFWITDVVSEIWGKKRADLMVIYGFLLSLIMLLIITLARALPAAEIWNIQADQASFFHPDHYLLDNDGNVLAVDAQAAQAAFDFTFDAPGLLLFASMLAYLTAQLLDNRLFHFWRRLTNGKFLWLRNNGSTVISQLIDTLIVNGIFLHFYWKMPWFSATVERPVTIVQVILTAYLAKIAMALLDTPFIYLGVYLIKTLLKRDQSKQNNLNRSKKT